ncbi:tRNA (adenine(22)-N(1))-methyltransferase [Streptococcus minor]|uniref:tRNA (adenine(22)-N(1))-methyltransferase n=1 Tax=Streptococcus minor TaxID=229549 RepID=UPI000382A3F9|nr:tRNA (adenine(22)-N(1))-methyltransferase TrmK [Streptococcus minor]MDO5078708.1 tRNA (adenine(22)-N(1))-methyltransferase TrmK [Streptococcus minor]
METKLSKRLAAVAAYVPKNSRLADVGSDHAYLPLFLVEKGHIDFAVAGEVVQGPYQSALANVTQASKQEQIQVRLANGLAAIDSSDQIDTITIAGMGGRLIADILSAGMDKLANVQRLILQPNNREDELRIWLEENGFQIVAEEIVVENQKFYEILVVEQGQMTLNQLEKRFGPYLMQEKSADFIAKWQNEARKLSQSLEKVPSDHQDDITLLREKIKAIKEVLDVSSSSD